jgi:hypothetical protein
MWTQGLPAETPWQAVRKSRAADCHGRNRRPFQYAVQARQGKANHSVRQTPCGIIAGIGVCWTRTQG